MIDRITFLWSGPLTPLDLHHIGEWLNVGIGDMPGHDARGDDVTITNVSVTPGGYAVEVSFKRAVRANGADGGREA